MECPFIAKDIILEGINKPINYKDLGGRVDYVFYDHVESDGNISRVQFCQLIGRKKDVFECFNESEWQECRVYRARAK